MQQEKMGAMTTGELIGRVLNNVALLTEKEIELAKLEARENVSQMVGSVVLLVGGAVLLLVAFVCLIVAGILALSAIMPGWLAAVLVGVFLAIVGLVLALIGRGRLTTKPLSRTLETLKEDFRWARQQLIPSEK